MRLSFVLATRCKNLWDLFAEVDMTLQCSGPNQEDLYANKRVIS